MVRARTNRKTGELVSLVLVEAVGSSITPFVPLPFVDDYLLARLFRRITRKVAERGGHSIDEQLAKAIVDGYFRAGDPGLGSKAFTAAVRFAVRTVAVVLDVKRGHDVFGESIAYALALDVAVELRALNAENAGTASTVGAAIHRATQSVGSAALEVITRAGREAWSASKGPETTGFSRVAEAIAQQVEDAHGRLDHLMRWELAPAFGGAAPTTDATPVARPPEPR
jgi:hypothetical protein